jgi:hypothetical protein
MLAGADPDCAVPVQFETVPPVAPAPAFPEVTLPRINVSLAFVVAKTATLDAPAAVSSGDAKFTSSNVTPDVILPCTVSAVPGAAAAAGVDTSVAIVELLPTHFQPLVQSKPP